MTRYTSFCNMAGGHIQMGGRRHGITYYPARCWRIPQFPDGDGHAVCWHAGELGKLMFACSSRVLRKGRLRAASAGVEARWWHRLAAFVCGTET